jgi:hypothetical protein
LHCTVVSHSFQAMADDAGSSAQRIRIGLTGLAIAFLLVLLGSVLVRSGDEDAQTSANTQINDAEPNEPLAQLGVAPGDESTANNSSDRR